MHNTFLKNAILLAFERLDREKATGRSGEPLCAARADGCVGGAPLGNVLNPRESGTTRHCWSPETDSGFTGKKDREKMTSVSCLPEWRSPRPESCGDIGEERWAPRGLELGTEEGAEGAAEGRDMGTDGAEGRPTGAKALSRVPLLEKSARRGRSGNGPPLVCAGTSTAITACEVIPGTSFLKKLQRAQEPRYFEFGVLKAGNWKLWHWELLLLTCNVYEE